MTDDDSGADWTEVLRANSTRADLEAAITHFAGVSLDRLREQLAAEPALTPRLRVAMVALATPLIEQQTREALEAGYLALQPVH